MKIVINRCYGGFSISKEAELFMADLGNEKATDNLGNNSDYREYDRNDPDLIAAVEELGEEANGTFASLKVVEIPNGIEWKIEEYDGMEWVSEVHRTWR